MHGCTQGSFLTLHLGITPCRQWGPCGILLNKPGTAAHKVYVLSLGLMLQPKSKYFMPKKLLSTLESNSE